MKVSELGEFGLVELLTKLVNDSKDASAEAWQKLIIGIGDDAAAWHTDGSVQLATVDSLIQGIHFTLDITSWRELGWKAMAINLSDIAAMGGSPQYALVCLTLPDSTEVNDVLDLYKGMIDLARESGVAIVGGDTNSGPLVIIEVTVTGKVEGENLLLRSTAKPGDKIAVTGYLGGAAGGLAILTKHLQLEPQASEYLKTAFLKPRARVREGQVLLEQGVKAAIDISDGLVADLGHICRASGVSARVEIDLLPVHSAVRANFGEQAIEMALTGGEDYELLFTAPVEIINRVKKELPCPVTVIGEITSGEAGKVVLVDSQGKPVRFASPGWEHFKAK